MLHLRILRDSQNKHHYLDGLCNKDVVCLVLSENLTFKNYFYKGRSDMIWTQLICSNFTILRLHTKQLLAQHIPLLGYTCTSLASPWELQMASLNNSLGVLQKYL